VRIRQSVRIAKAFRLMMGEAPRDYRKRLGDSIKGGGSLG
jgi:hypothetical protein